MNNKKIQAQMQIDVSFLSKGLSLTKDIQSQLDKVKFTGPLTKHFTDDMSKQFKAIETNYNKMIAGLSKKGLSSKQYTAIFEEGSLAIKKNIDNIKDIGKALKEAYNSKEQKDLLKGLEAQKQLLIDIKKLQTSMKQSNAAGAKATSKLKDEFGLDFGNSEVRNVLKAVKARRGSGNKTLTAKQSTVLGTDDQAKVERILKLYNQILSALEKVKIKQAEINGVGGVEGLEKKIALLEKNIIKDGQVTIYEEMGKDAEQALPKVKAFDNELSRSQTEAEKAAKASQSLKEVFAQFGIVFSAASIARGFKDLIKSSFEFYKSLDSALNEIYVVSNLTSKEVDGLKNNFINMAKETGMALDDVTRSAVLFYQQGLNTDAVMEMTKVTAQFAKVAGIDATDAADKLTAAVNGYCLSSKEAMEVADKFNKVAAVSAADINELSTAFSKAAAQANQAGVSMDNYLAYIATMEEATREAPENLGTSLKTIFSRMQQIKTGENTEDDVDVNAVETALRTVNIQLRDTDGQLRDLEEIFDELGPKWNTLNRNTQAYLGTIIAGTRQQSRFITLMQNWSRVQELAAESENSAGQQALMHAKAMESIESKLNQLNVAWQQFISNLANSSFFKTAIGGLTKIIKLINSGNKPMALLALGITTIASKLKNLQIPLLNKIKGIIPSLKSFMGAGGFTSSAQKTRALDANKQAQEESAQRKKDLEDRQLKLRAHIEQLEASEAIKNKQEEINNAKKRELELQNEINKEEKNQVDLQEEQKRLENSKIVSKRQKIGAGLQAAGTGLTIAGMMGKDANIGGAMSTLGTGLTAAGQFASGDFIGGAISAGTAFIQLTKVIGDWKANIKKKVTDAVNEINGKLEELGNLRTTQKSLESARSKYTKLSGVIHKTAEEQSQLNDAIQQLSDMTGIEAVEDAYGNLSINMKEVDKYITEIIRKTEKSARELDDLEKEKMKSALGLDTISQLTGQTNSFYDYFEEMFSTNYSEFRNLLNGVKDDLDEESRGISSSLANAFSTNLKSALMEDLEKNADTYTIEGKGLREALVNNENTINKSLNKKDWQGLYKEIDFLKQNVNTMTFEEVQDHMEKFYQSMGGETKMAREEWELLVDSINNTVFENSSLLDFYKKVDELKAKNEGTFYQDKIDKINKRLEQIDMKAQYKKVPVLGHIASGIYDLGTFFSNDVAPDLSKAMGNYNYDEEETRKLKNIKKNLEKQQAKFREEIKEENPLLVSDEDVDKWVGSYERISNTLKKVTTETQDYLSEIPSLYDLTGLDAEDSEAYTDFLNTYLQDLDRFSSDAEKYNFLAKAVESEDLAPAVKEKLETVMNEAFNNLQVAVPRSLTEIANELENIGDKLIQINDIVDEFNEQGAISFDTFKNLANILDTMDLKALGQLDSSYIDQYINAIHNLNLAYDENSGYITMNGDAVQSLQQIQELQTKSKIAGMINELKAARASTEVQLKYIEAQIDGTDAAIKYAEAEEGEYVNTKKVKQEADKVFTKNFDDSVNSIAEAYKTDVTNQNEWATATLNNISKVSEAWSKYFEAVAQGDASNLDELKKKAKNMVGEIKKTNKYAWEGANSSSGIDWGLDNDLIGDLVDRKKMIEQLNAYREKLVNSRSQTQATLDTMNLEINLLEDMMGKDLSKLFGSGGGGTDKSKIEKYIGQLKEIYNILNRIQMLEHRLSTLDTYADIAQGKEYGDLLQQRLGYNEELLNQYAFLVSEQKQFTNGYKDFIQSVDGLEGVFDFDQFGQIIINWEKYNSLQDEAIDGETTLKEKADDVYNTYTSMMSELQGYFDKYISYLKNTLNLLNEVRSNYVDLENKAASAMQEIYKKELDAKLEAIDKEMKALEELTQARQKANKERDNAKALSGYQADLQRAMMDTSGASDANYIKAQQNISDKLDAMAEDKYSEMINDIKKQLEEEKDVLQKNFDELFENQEWLYAFLDTSVMGDFDAVKDILTQTEAWAKESPTNRWEEVRNWDKLFNSYAQDGIYGTKGINGVLDKIVETEGQIAELDRMLKNENSKGDANIIQTIEKWAQKVADAAASGHYNNGSGGGGGGNPTGDSGANHTQGKYYTDYTGPNGQWVNEDAKYGVFKNTVDKNQKAYQPDNVGNDPLIWTKLYASDYGIYKNSSGVSVSGQKLWYTKYGHKLYVWNGTKGEYELAGPLKDNYNKLDLPRQEALDIINKNKWKAYAHGGLANFTGPAWLDGTSAAPEAVLDALQTKHFIDFTNTLDKMYSNIGQAGVSNASNVTIDNISFNVESMSSPEDGEKAFNAFVDKFKEIGDRTGLKVQTFKNTL